MIGKQGASMGQSFGAIALFFSLYDTLVTNVRGVDDELNYIPSSVLTGLTYSATRGVKTMAKSGLIGLVGSLAYFAVVHKESVLNKLPNVSPQLNNKY